MSKLIENRRQFLQFSGRLLGVAGVASVAGARALNAAPSFITLEHNRPQLDQGIQFGDAGQSNGIVWGRTDRPSTMYVEYSYYEDFKRAKRVKGPTALPSSDYSTRIDLTDLPSNADVFVKVTYKDLSNDRICSQPVLGSFRTAPMGADRDIHFLWSGDTAGQGWGINLEFGGMKIYQSMKNENADFFIHCGDTVYADGPIQETQEAEDGLIWNNLVTEEVSKVAETLDEFRGRYKYNLLDHNVRDFNASTAQIWQWDDHEVVNNWSDSKDLSEDDRYTEKNVPLLIARGAKAFLEYAPLRPYDARERDRVYRHIPYGELMDTFVLDMRSYRAANSANDQDRPSSETRFLGRQQLSWLKKSLLNSRATWKVIASDMPIGLIVRDGAEKFENMANGDGEPLGRELEMANLLKFIKRNKIKNVVWFTADVHYCAAHYYSPENAVFKHFSPFWEFVAGPLNAGSFGPNALDNTFGPEVVFSKAAPTANASPFAGFQFYGDVMIDALTSAMTVSLKDIHGDKVFEKTLEPEEDYRGRYRKG